DKSLIRTGADLCAVEAAFSGNDLQKLNPRLIEAGIEPCEGDLIIKRTLRNWHKSAVHQRLAHHFVDLEKSRRRTCRSSRPARPPISIFVRQAIRLARFVCARRRAGRRISKALSP